MKQKIKDVFRSRPFYYKYNQMENLHSFLRNKLVWLLLLLFIFLLCFSITIGIGYQPKFLHTSVLPFYNPDGSVNENLLPELPQNIRTLRGVAIFFGGWFVMIYAWIIKLGVNMIQQNQKTFGFLYCFSGFYIPVLLIYELVKLNKTSFKMYVKSWFENDPYYDGYQYYRNYSYWIAVASLFITAPILWFALIRNSDLKIIISIQGYKDNIWFDSFQYFTIQTNLMCYITLLAFVINPKWKLFKNNDVLVALCAYITIVSIIFFTAILPFKLDKYLKNPYKMGRTIVEHAINPVTFIICFILIMFKNPQGCNDYLTTLKYSLIVPLIYGVYALISPFFAGVSVYSILTNTNPLLHTNSGYSGSYWAFLVYPGFVIIFSGFITLYWWINYRFYHAQNKRVLYNEINR